MKRDYHKFKKEVLTRDNYSCSDCGAIAIHIIFLDPIKKKYNCTSYQLILNAMESVCLKCYYKKLSTTIKRNSF